MKIGGLVRSAASAIPLLAIVCLASPSAQAAAIPKALHIAYVQGDYPKPDHLSIAEITPDDAGLAGARIALDEINISGRFLGYAFDMESVRLDGRQGLAAQLAPVLARTQVVVADLEPKDLLALADMPQAKGAVLLDVRTHDDALRQTECRRNTFHVAPSDAMLTDALGQYLVTKRWPRWLLLQGTSPGDAAYADDIVRTAKKFGAKVVERRTYGYDPGARRVDTGYQQIQTQMPLATRNAPDYDVLFVADISGVFGDYLPYATSSPRPVVGTQGLVPTTWSPAFQEYSALQMQHRFNIAAKRPMLEADYEGWLAVRIIGDAVLRSNGTDSDIGSFLRSPAFETAGFKGQSLTFRAWDQQLRQPILLSTPLMVVSMSPQDGFLHPHFLTDTLGFDAPESTCRLAG